MAGHLNTRIATRRALPTLAILAFTLTSLSACQTVKMPNLDSVIKSPEFKEDADRIGRKFPKVADAPTVPEDFRSANAWDNDAKRMQALRSELESIDMVSGPDDTEADARLEALRAKAQAYKQDDPPGGIETDFPDIPPKTPPGATPPRR